MLQGGFWGGTYTTPNLAFANKKIFNFLFAHPLTFAKGCGKSDYFFPPFR